MITPAQFGPRGEHLLITFEGYRAHAYRDSRGIWTVGYGHTGHDVVEGTVVTEQHALILLRSDVAGVVACLQRSITRPVNQNQFDALVCFAYNVGRGSLLRSTLLAKVNQGDFEAAAGCFHDWITCDGEIIPGLVRRREAEAALFQEKL